MSEQSPAIYEFGPFSLDAGKRLLFRHGEPVPLAPKVLDTLIALVENRAGVVTKDELLKQVWGDTSVEEGGLTRNVSMLRKALGEKPDDHQYIVTVPARGYKFVAEVRPTPWTVRSEDAPAPASPEGAAPLVRGASMDARTTGVRRWVALVAACTILMVGAAALGWRQFAHRPAPIRIAVLPLENLSPECDPRLFRRRDD